MKKIIQVDLPAPQLLIALIEFHFISKYYRFFIVLLSI